MDKDIERRVNRMIDAIENAAIRNRLNLTIYDGKIGFVDQKQRKIVALWTAKYKMPAAETNGGSHEADLV